MELLLPNLIDGRLWLRMITRKNGKPINQVVFHEMGKRILFHSSGSLADAPKHTMALYYIKATVVRKRTQPRIFSRIWMKGIFLAHSMNILWTFYEHLLNIYSLFTWLCLVCDFCFPVLTSTMGNQDGTCFVLHALKADQSLYSTCHLQCSPQTLEALEVTAKDCRWHHRDAGDGSSWRPVESALLHLGPPMFVYGFRHQNTSLISGFDNVMFDRFLVFLYDALRMLKAMPFMGLHLTQMIDI